MIGGGEGLGIGSSTGVIGEEILDAVFDEKTLITLEREKEQLKQKIVELESKIPDIESEVAAAKSRMDEAGAALAACKS